MLCAETYADTLRDADVASCTPCATGLTTAVAAGATSSGDCNECEAGYGGSTQANGGTQYCTTQCGGAAGTYGPAGRKANDDQAACTDCPRSIWTFRVDGGKDDYTPASVAPEGATESTQCLAQAVQIGYDAWYLGGAGVDNVANTLTACVGACVENADCQYITFAYTAADAQKCKLRIRQDLSPAVNT